MAKKSTSPQIVSPFAPLEQLTLRALKRHGEMSASTVEGEVQLMFLDYANRILDDVMAHPYWDKGVEIPYYSHQTEFREVPDTMMVAGLLSKFSTDQESRKAKDYEADYLRSLNQTLHRRKFGVGAEYEMQAIDVSGGGVL